MEKRKEKEEESKLVTFSKPNKYIGVELRPLGDF